MILFYNEDILMPKIQKRVLKNWIKKIAIINSFQVGDINFIFCSNNYILDINLKYLSHNYFTDIITFNYNSNKTIAGDIFISIETVIQNASEYSVSFDDELKRVIIHGILHLIGYDDQTVEQKSIMSEQENQALLLYMS